MLHELGLSRDPFAEVWDGSLYWESPERRAVRERIAELLRAGQSVWLWAAPGAGRSTLLSRVAEDLSSEGARAALLPEPRLATAEAFLQDLASLLSAPCSPSAPLLDLAATVYQRLVDIFCERSVWPLVVPWTPNELVRHEVGILADLRLLGGPLLAIGVPGHDTPPSDSFRSVELPAPTREELRQCLVHRCAACGRPDVLPVEALNRVIEQAEGFGDALRRARAELARQAFGQGISLARPAAVPVAPTRQSVLDPLELEEVDRLLDALRPDSADSQKGF